VSHDDSRRHWIESTSRLILVPLVSTFESHRRLPSSQIQNLSGSLSGVPLAAGFTSSAAVLGCAGLVAALDQIAKRYAMRRLTDGRVHQLIAGVGFCRADHDMGSRRSYAAWGAIALWSAALGAFAWSLAATRLPHEVGAIVGFGLILGGAAGNLIDWLGRGAIVDFISVARWPLFNLADAALCIGLLVTVWSLL
jgi:signal peptidase II